MKLIFVIALIASPAFGSHVKSRVLDSLPDPPPVDYEQCNIVTEAERQDCFPGDGPTQEGCESRGCCWSPAKEGIPACFHQPNVPGYTLINKTQTISGFDVFWQRNFKSPYPGDVEVLKMELEFESDYRLRIKIVDPTKRRYEALYPKIAAEIGPLENPLYQVEVTDSNLRIFRKSDDIVLFDALNFTNFIYAEQFLQIGTKLPTSNIYGIGEHHGPLNIGTDWERKSLLNHDAIPTFKKNLYGSHPFYLALEESSNAHGVFLVNSNAMEVVTQPLPALTFRTIGGILDFYVLLGPTPNDVIRQYTEVIGRPAMPPYWSLGYHLCRYGYKDLDEVKAVLKRNLDAGIPLDTIWNDLDYMQNQAIFTYNKDTFADLPAFIDQLHQDGRHWIPLVDPGVSPAEEGGSYAPYEDGIDMDIFIKNANGSILIGKVWNPISTVFPDFTHPNATPWWTKQFKSFNEEIKLDGAWIDMNEISNFVAGSVDGCPESPLEDPPGFSPRVAGGPLRSNTVCMTAKQYAGNHYDLHNLYAVAEAHATYDALVETRGGKRPVIISRASFPGLGIYGGHWSGDIVSTWEHMEFSIPQLLSFSLYGIPLMGADICGFVQSTTPELCNRWIQLGAFYPFSRTHNDNGSKDQDPASMGDDVIESARTSLHTRYLLLPYLYDLFWRAHAFGDTVARPIFFEFSDDPNTVSIDKAFLWGPALMIVPILENNATTVKTYFPKGFWYDYYTEELIKSEGAEMELPVELHRLNLYVRGGYILPQQDTDNTTTTQSRQTKLSLLAAADDEENAEGEFYWDDGDTVDSYAKDEYTLYSFSVSSGKLVVNAEHLSMDNTLPNLGAVTVFGIKNKNITSVSLGDGTELSFTYSETPKLKKLVIWDLDIQLNDGLEIQWR